VIKNILCIFLILVVACSGTQRLSANSISLLHFDMDGSVPFVDYSLYDVPAINITEVSIRLSSDPPDGAYMVRVDAGSRAPYTGVLFNDLASAYIMAEFTAAMREQILTNNIEQRRLAGRALTDLEHYRASYTALGETARIIINGQDQEYQRLTQILNREMNSNRPNFLSNVLWIGLGTLIGFGLAGLIAILSL
jgi:hypothetical protein